MEWSEFCQCVPAIESLTHYLSVGEWSRLRVASVEFARMSKTMDTILKNRQRDLAFCFMDMLLLKREFNVIIHVPSDEQVEESYLQFTRQMIWSDAVTTLVLFTIPKSLQGILRYL